MGARGTKCLLVLSRRWTKRGSGCSCERISSPLWRLRWWCPSSNERYDDMTLLILCKIVVVSFKNNFSLDTFRTTVMPSLTPHGSRYQNIYSQPPSWCPQLIDNWSERKSKDRESPCSWESWSSGQVFSSFISPKASEASWRRLLILKLVCFGYCDCAVVCLL